MAIYGGFDPTIGDIAWEDRDWVNHETILSGDLIGDDDRHPAITMTTATTSCTIRTHRSGQHRRPGWLYHHRRQR